MRVNVTLSVEGCILNLLQADSHVLKHVLVLHLVPGNLSMLFMTLLLFFHHEFVELSFLLKILILHVGKLVTLEIFVKGVNHTVRGVFSIICE